VITGWLDLMKYYIDAFKTGVYGAVDLDRIFLWARLYPANADAPDSIGKPANWQWVSPFWLSFMGPFINDMLDQTEDYLWAAVFLKSSADVTMSCGLTSYTVSLEPGLWKMKLLMTADCDVVVEICRYGIGVLTFKPNGFSFGKNPRNYNFNAFVAASP